MAQIGNIEFPITVTVLADQVYGIIFSSIYVPIFVAK